MGDVGSTFLGSFYAGSMLQAAELGAGLGLLLLIPPLIADAAEPSAMPQWPLSRAFAKRSPLCVPARRA